MSERTTGWDLTCSFCDGLGRRWVGEEDGFGEWAQCEACDGRGEFPPCRRCNGSGKVWLPPPDVGPDWCPECGGAG